MLNFKFTVKKMLVQPKYKICNFIDEYYSCNRPELYKMIKVGKKLRWLAADLQR